jgi:hypothetical protein
MHATQTLIPAQELAANNKAHYPNESAEYRAARNELLVEESNCVATWSASRHSGAVCLPAVRFLRTSSLPPKPAPSASPVFSATNPHS